MDVSKTLESLKSGGAGRDAYEFEDVNKQGIVTEITSKKDDEMRKKTTSEFKDQMYNKDISDDPKSRLRNNTKRYGIALYLGKDGNNDQYVQKTGVEGTDAYIFKDTDSAEGGMKRSNVMDYAKQSGLDNALMDLRGKGINMASQINSLQDHGQKAGGEKVIIMVRPESGTLDGDQRKEVLDVMMANGVTDSNVQLVNQAEVEKDSEAKWVFSKQQAISKDIAMDSIAGIDEKGISMPGTSNKIDNDVNDKKQQMEKEGKTMTDNSKKLRVLEKNEDDKDWISKIGDNKDGTMNKHQLHKDAPAMKKLSEKDEKQDIDDSELDEIIKKGTKANDEYEFENKNGNMTIKNRKTGKTFSTGKNAQTEKFGSALKMNDKKQKDVMAKKSENTKKEDKQQRKDMNSIDNDEIDDEKNDKSIKIDKKDKKGKDVMKRAKSKK